MHHMAVIHDICTCLAFLTRINISRSSQEAAKPLSACAWAFPLAGLLCGGMGAAVLLASQWMGLVPAIGAMLAIASVMVGTGGLHEDGLADCADGFYGASDRARKLDIMKDSRIGTFGVLALLMVVLLKIAALISVPVERAAIALLSAEMISRALLPLMMYHLPLARQGGLAGAAGKPARVQALLAVKIALVLGLLFLWKDLWLVIMACIMAYGLVRTLAMHHIGGYTGDVLGTLQQVSCTFILIVLSS